MHPFQSLPPHCPQWADLHPGGVLEGLDVEEVRVEVLIDEVLDDDVTGLPIAIRAEKKAEDVWSKATNLLELLEEELVGVDELGGE